MLKVICPSLKKIDFVLTPNSDISELNLVPILCLFRIPSCLPLDFFASETRSMLEGSERNWMVRSKRGDAKRTRSKLSKLLRRQSFLQYCLKIIDRYKISIYAPYCTP